MGRQKIDPWISTIVLIKVFGSVTNNNTDLITVSIAFLFFIWALFHQKNIRYSAVISAKAFSFA